jgi:hypothetical protein
MRLNRNKLMTASNGLANFAGFPKEKDGTFLVQ